MTDRAAAIAPDLAVATVVAPQHNSASILRREPGIFVLTTAYLFLGVMLTAVGNVPWSDAGGYENMLRHFLATGCVDYMHWSQPTFIGILPIAAPWAYAFGTSTLSLDLLGLLFGAAVLVGTYVCGRQRLAPRDALIVCAGLLCFSEFALCSATFMTDIPYLAYLVWFLVAHQRLARAAVAGTASPRLWVAWCVLLLFAALTRSFALVMVPILGVDWLLARHGERPARVRLLAAAILTCAASLLIARAIGRNAFSPADLTVLPHVARTHNIAGIEWRALAVSVLQLSAAAAPVALLLARRPERRKRIGYAVITGIALIAAVRFASRGLLDPFGIGGGWWGALAGVASAAAGVPFVAGALWHALSVQRDVTARTLALVALAHLAPLPFMLHPLYRHALPAFAAILLLLPAEGMPTRRTGIAAAAAVAAFAAVNLRVAASARASDAAIWDAANTLVKRGVAPTGIDAGWNWFCAHDMVPGSKSATGYVQRYHDTVAGADYVVAREHDGPKGGQVVATHHVTFFGCEESVSVVARRPEHAPPAEREHPYTY